MSFLKGPLTVIIASVALISLCGLSCTSSRCVFDTPDQTRFDRLVRSSALHDSLRANTLCVGMPYFVVRQVLGSCKGEVATPVASVGSRTNIRDIEGWGRASVDVSIKVYFDEYNTDQGKLRIWYQYPDFYRMNISARDSLFLVSSTNSASSVIECLRSFDKLRVKDTLATMPEGDTLYGEIHSIENTRRRSPITYWYLIRLLSDHRTVALMAPDIEYYPIEQLEINGNPVESFRWRKTP